MSYCRFSEKSDVYAFHDGQAIHVQVAQFRLKEDHDHEELTVTQMIACKGTKIYHVDAGRSLIFKSACQAIRKIQEWRTEGVLMIPHTLEHRLYHNDQT